MRFPEGEPGADDGCAPSEKSALAELLTAVRGFPTELAPAPPAGGEPLNIELANDLRLFDGVDGAVEGRRAFMMMAALHSSTRDSEFFCEKKI